jgi:hypothetical protein
VQAGDQRAADPVRDRHRLALHREHLAMTAQQVPPGRPVGHVVESPVQVHHEVRAAGPAPRALGQPGRLARPHPGQVIFEAQRGQHLAGGVELPGRHQQVDVAVVTAARRLPVEAVCHGRAFQQHAVDGRRCQGPDHLARGQIQGQGASRHLEVGLHD